jgi:hypothetical protein
MHRLIALSLLSGVFLCSAGCFHTRKQYKDEQEPWNQAAWKQALHDDELRQKTEEQRRAEAMLPGVRDGTDAVWDQLARIYNYLRGRTPFDAARGMLDPADPDRRRQGVVWLSARPYGRQDPYLRYYSMLARTDPDHTVRAMAIRALNRARNRETTSIYLAALNDGHPLVRLEAAKALANMPEPLAMNALIRRLQDTGENVDVRVACADGLRAYRETPAASALASVLRDREFAVSWQARRSLRLMTGQDHRYNQAAWLTYLLSSERPLG